MFWKVDAAALDYRDYLIRYEGDGKASLYTRQPLEHFVKAREACRPFLNNVSGMSDYDKLYAAACEICSRLDYVSQATTVPSDLFTTDGVHYGNCMSFAHALQYLCTLMDIPCILVHSEIHQWNEVWLNGKWEPIDLTSFEIGYTERGYDNLLSDPQDWQGKIFAQTEPELTRFAKEVLVPESTK